PLTLIGVVLALLMFRSTLSIFSIIGVVMLMGLVTKNAILLVDFAIRMRDQGMERGEALLHAAKVRLRPILMTTLAMVFGMVPLAFALTEGSEQRAPIGQAAAGRGPCPPLELTICPDPRIGSIAMNAPADLERARFNMIEQQIRPW